MGSSVFKIKNNKCFNKDLVFIKAFNSLEDCEIKILDAESITSRMYKKQSKLIVEYCDIRSKNDEEIEFSFIYNNHVYYAVRFGNSSRHAHFEKDSNSGLLTKVELQEMKSSKFVTKGKFKSYFLQSIDKKINSFFNEFETVTFTRNDTEYYYDCLRIKISSKTYDVTLLKEEESNYFIIECLEDQDFELFSEACFSIQQAIGFITSLMIGGEKFIFDCNGNFYYSNYSRPSISGLYTPITFNPDKFSCVPRRVSEKFHNQLNRISLNDLSKLTQRIHDELEFSTAILIILESTSVRSLLLIPSSFAVIIEQLSKHLSVEENEVTKPIDNNNENNILKQLCNVIDNNCDILSNKSVLTLKRRLKGINRPINKKHLTNNEKLTRPFEQLNIKLTSHDIDIIEHRNDLFHGNVLLNEDGKREIETNNVYMAYVSAKLFTLISKLILKSIGYNGFIYNQSKYLEEYLSISTNEDYFEKI